MNRKSANALRRLVLVDDGTDWILIVTILAQRDDGVFTSPKGECGLLLVSGSIGLQ